MFASFSVLFQMEPWRWNLLTSKVLSVWKVNIDLLESWQSPDWPVGCYQSRSGDAMDLKPWWVSPSPWLTQCGCRSVTPACMHFFKHRVEILIPTQPDRGEWSSHQITYQEKMPLPQDALHPAGLRDDVGCTFSILQMRAAANVIMMITWMQMDSVLTLRWASWTSVSLINSVHQ